MAKKTSIYFKDFITMAEYSCQAADYLRESLRDFRPETLSQRREAMHKIEHDADQVKHEMMQRLVKEFVPPIDREDIIQLSSVLDDVTDKIDDILIRMYMYHVQRLRPAALDFAEVIASCCDALRRAMVEFPNFQRSTTLLQDLINVNAMEERGDALYIDAVRELYEQEESPIEIVAWSELFDRLEDCCDACEHVADTMEMIAMKNA